MNTIFGLFEGDSPSLQLLGKWGATVWDARDIYQMQIHLLAAAIFPIYIGAHASLRRPSSAAAPKKAVQEYEDDDEIEVDPVVEGLRPSDAIIFPLLASFTLGGLYFIIKWLEDPAILNKIMTWYFSALGVFGVGKLAADSLQVISTFVYPSVWSDGKSLYHVKQDLRVHVKGASAAKLTRKSPLPGFLVKLPFSETYSRSLWEIRGSLKKHYIFRTYLSGIVNSTSRVTCFDIAGLALGLVAIVAWNVGGKAWWLTNLMGFGFCYGAFQLMSPTTFWTGSLVLMGLFVYDIVMVFYTPMMITVATSLDVPIKLVFPGPKRGGMLGLGDVVLPGIIMALALRFDFYLHYLRKSIPANSSASFGTPKPTKATYADPTGLWGERWWTSTSKEPNVADPARFQKTYFYASIVGYIVGMMTTLVVLNYFHHAQPALLYLVPGVLISLWGTAWVRGEIPLMWGYTEDGSMEEQDDAKPSKDPKVEAQAKDAKESKSKQEHAHHVFLFSLSDPKRVAKNPKLVGGELKEG